MNFLEICGVLWLVSVGAGGLWVGLCYATDWLKRRRGRLGATPGGTLGNAAVAPTRGSTPHAPSLVLLFENGSRVDLSKVVRRRYLGEARDV